MTITFDRKIYFDMVRPMFGGALSQGQVDGQNFILTAWEKHPISDDLRHLAYPLATTKHETASTMLPIEEYGRGKGHVYGKVDPETGQTYYGRGFVQLTWRDNYRKASDKLGLEGEDDLEWHAEKALDPLIAARIMFRGMEEGWFRTGGGKPETLRRYFDDDTDDAFGAREIINGDKKRVPDWSGGKSIGTLIADFHESFLAALVASFVEVVEPPPVEEVPVGKIEITLTVKGVNPEDVVVVIV